MISVDYILKIQARDTADWHVGAGLVEKDQPFNFIQENNHWNYQLWHEEDIARKPDIDPVEMVVAKRNIDHFNQQRNNAMEKIDEWVASILIEKERPLNVKFHSETPGMMIDRLSIMTLKKYHMREEWKRDNATNEHKQKCRNMVLLLDLQIDDLCKCLTEILDKLENGQLQFRVYRQIKMYNDPNLNPQLYANDRIKDSKKNSANNGKI